MKTIIVAAASVMLLAGSAQHQPEPPIVAEMEAYWAEIKRLNTTEHRLEEFAYRINVDSSYFDLAKGYEKSLAHLSQHLDTFRDSDESLQQDFEGMLERKGIAPAIFEDIPDYENPFNIRNWESHNLGTPNIMQLLRIDLIHMEIKYLEVFLTMNSEDVAAQERLDELKKQFADLAQTATIAD